MRLYMFKENIVMLQFLSGLSLITSNFCCDKKKKQRHFVWWLVFYFAHTYVPYILTCGRKLTKLLWTCLFNCILLTVSCEISRLERFFSSLCIIYSAYLASKSRVSRDLASVSLHKGGSTQRVHSLLSLKTKSADIHFPRIFSTFPQVKIGWLRNWQY